jgi:hypothetical protein
MIITKLIGGLGNQLFQWACARNLQKIYNHKLMYDDHILNCSGYDHRINAYIVRKQDIYRFPKIKMENNHLYSNQLYENNSYKIYDNFNYETFSKINFLDVNSIYYLDGYWQGEKYFKDVSNEIRYELSPTEEFIKNNIVDKNALSIHVRRTDYLGLSDTHPVQTLSYYESAIDLLNHTGNIYIFSDDIEWCKQNFKFKNMHFIHNEDALVDLWMMSACEKNVIANSTFSWWAAWLNNHPNKRIVCPKNWFGPKAPYSDKDILDNDWIKL